MVLRRKLNWAKKVRDVFVFLKKRFKIPPILAPTYVFLVAHVGACGVYYLFASWGWGFKKPLSEITGKCVG